MLENLKALGIDVSDWEYYSAISRKLIWNVQCTKLEDELWTLGEM